ncbi:MAG: hypothetical protein ABIW38_02050 [Ferruginibacter sp.]
MRLFFATALLAIAGCNSPDKTENASMPGAYKMVSQNFKSDKIDTTNTSIQQLKIYTDDYMMYAGFSPSDSSGTFGIGTYSATKDTVTENVIYSASDTSKNETPAIFNLVITKTPKGFKQFIPEIKMGDQKFSLTEEYDAAGTATKSPLDGAWKLTKSYSIMGKDSFPETKTQFKIYGSGYFIFGQTFSDSANKSHTAMGYGKFVMTGTTKSKESVLVSSFYQVRGQDVDIDIEMNGTDEYKQTYSTNDGYKGVEIYQRMKK